MTADVYEVVGDNQRLFSFIEHPSLVEGLPDQRVVLGVTPLRVVRVASQQGHGEGRIHAIGDLNRFPERFALKGQDHQEVHVWGELKVRGPFSRVWLFEGGREEGRRRKAKIEGEEADFTAEGGCATSNNSGSFGVRCFLGVPSYEPFAIGLLLLLQVLVERGGIRVLPLDLLADRT